MAPRPAPGTPVRLRYTKFDGSPHWVTGSVYLGEDEHGAWLGQPTGTHSERPGAAYDAVHDTVVLVPEAGWVASFNAWHAKGTRIYVDLTSTPRWTQEADGWSADAVDLDLDVLDSGIRPVPFIDDEDEFADHQVRYGYPAELVAQVRADADALLDQVTDHKAPFDGATADRWFAVLRALDLPLAGLAAAPPGPDGLVVREVSLADERAALAAHGEFQGWHFLLSRPDGASWPEYVEHLALERRGLGVALPRVPHAFLLGEVGGEVVGRVSVRLALNEALQGIGGHIGYGVRPAFRGRGYATAMLRAGLAVAAAHGIDRALLTCDDDNAPSARTIERCGGVLDAVVQHGGTAKRRYWIAAAGA